MSAEESSKDEPQVEVSEPPKSPIEPPTELKKRPRIDVSALTGGRDRKRGKGMLGVLMGTLNKAKIEDKERNASDAAKKRHLIDQRLQAKLKKETDSVRRAEEVKKDKTHANRKEEDLQLKDSIYKLRRKRLPVLSNFLVTSDIIPDDDKLLSPSPQPLAPPPRSHPPPLYYLPAVLTPAQEAFLAQKKKEVAEATEQEWQGFVEDKKAGIEQINTLRQRVADEAAHTKGGSADRGEMDTDGLPLPSPMSASKDAEMEVDHAATPKDDSKATSVGEREKKDESAMQADDEEAVEY